MKILVFVKGEDTSDMYLNMISAVKRVFFFLKEKKFKVENEKDLLKVRMYRLGVQ